ncbi:DUF4012 domain-containing protein [Micromonospora sp. NPDC050397]|uniref:DUF4012 domain-containing protein n=1 Tax=Micromonospora sp. NPDC050397 TaxID=3364279 RepID=UPI00384D236E
MRRALITVLVVTCLLFLGVGWLGLRGWQARGHLVSAAGLARELGQQVLAGDSDQARRTLSALQSQAGAARSATGDPSWAAARHTPYAGDDLSAVRTIAVAVDDLARHAFPSLLRLDLTTLVPKAGQLDLARLQAAAPELTTADDAVRQANDRVAAIRPEGLQKPVRDAVRELRAELERLAALTTTARHGAVLLPPLLGAGGPRTYLVAFQNLAEPRSTGGIFGAYAVLRAERGKVQILKQGAASELGMFDEPVTKLDPNMKALYTELPGIYPADVNLTPHFPTAASIFREMYKRRTGTVVDGVLATDPVTLSYLLQAIGPVPVPKHPTLTSDSAVKTLLSDAYHRIKAPRDQDKYFASAAMSVFDALLTRTVNPRQLLEALDRAVAERRILFWSANPDEQDDLVDTRVAGVMPEREDTPTVGVFLNDGTGSKLGYYLTRSAELTVGDCRLDGRRELKLRLTIGSTAPSKGLSQAVLGLQLPGDPYRNRVVAYVFSPVGGSPVNARLDGAAAPIGVGTERGRRVAVLSVDIPPGKTRELEVTLLTPVTRTGAADLWLTPGATPWTTRVKSATRCEQ